jgi:predicted MFS family arabinose efflux permease
MRETAEIDIACTVSEPLSAAVNWRALLPAILTVVTGAQVVIIQPVVVQALTEYAGFSAEQSGYILSAEMWGFAVTTIAMVVLVSRFHWHRLIYTSVGLMLCANVSSLLATDATTLSICRFIAGLGAGGLVSLGFAAVGRLPQPDRCFGFAVTGALTYGALVVAMAPFLFQLGGYSAIVILFVVTGLLCLGCVRKLPSAGIENSSHTNNASSTPWPMRLSALAAMMVYFAAQGAVWSYLFLIGTDAGLSENEVAYGLGVAQFAGIAGALTAAMVATRFGRVAPLSAGILFGILPLVYLFSNTTSLLFAIVVCLYNFGWNMTHPYLLGVMSSLDNTGATVVYAVAMQKIGLAIGPAVAAMALAGSGYHSVLLLGMGLFAASLFLIFWPALHCQKGGLDPAC